ncbi:MAG: tRNA (adenosine(37)-N6)-dimethylallyltransferase MiaA [Solirubrobacterales bacterium]
MKTVLAAILGPTGTGKTDTALRVAARLGKAEIISCDSMQIYRGMDIGTAKLPRSEMGSIPHHLIDVVDPDAAFSVTDYQRLARVCIDEIGSRGALPILVGGTGLYYQAVVDDYELQPMDRDLSIRERLEAEAEEAGNAALHQRLSRLDSEAAARIQPNDRKRIIRALEVIETTGKPFSAQQKRSGGRYQLAAVGLTCPREEMYRRINDRVELMIQAGWLEETERLAASGYDVSYNSMQAIGYRHLTEVLAGKTTLTEAVARIQMETRRYAKRQLTWFRRDPRIKWFDVTESRDADEQAANISTYICRTIKSSVE